jgi:hypothetical protein
LKNCLKRFCAEIEIFRSKWFTCCCWWYAVDEVYNNEWSIIWDKRFNWNCLIKFRRDNRFMILKYLERMMINGYLYDCCLVLFFFFFLFISKQKTNKSNDIENVPVWWWAFQWFRIVVFEKTIYVCLFCICKRKRNDEKIYKKKKY